MPPAGVEERGMGTDGLLVRGFLEGGGKRSVWTQTEVLFAQHCKCTECQ